MAKLVKAGVTLRDQVDAKFINRDKSSDGWIGNSEHAARASFHNPDKRGWVFALDIDENFGVGKWRNGGTAKRFANELIAYSRSTLPGHDRVLHVTRLRHRFGSFAVAGIRIFNTSTLPSPRLRSKTARCFRCPV
jgi:hypothetical protein